MKYLHLQNNIIREEVLLCVGHILSDVQYNTLKYFCAEDVMNNILEILEKSDTSYSVVNLSIWVLISITRGKNDFITKVINFLKKDCYRVILRYLNQFNNLSLKDYFILFLLFCEQPDFIQFFSINDENYLIILDIVRANKESSGVAKLGIKVLALLLFSAEFCMIEKLINKGMLSLFIEILLKKKNEKLKKSVLECLLYLSNTNIKIIRLIVEEVNMMLTLQKLLKYDCEKRIVYNILFNILFNGDYECASFLISQTRFIKIIVEFFNQSLSINGTNLHLVVNCTLKLIELDVYKPFLDGCRMKECLIENGLMIELDKLIQLSEKPNKIIEELVQILLSN